MLENETIPDVLIKVFFSKAYVRADTRTGPNS
jgi:hypothetical protein